MCYFRLPRKRPCAARWWQRTRSAWLPLKNNEKWKKRREKKRKRRGKKRGRRGKRRGMRDGSRAGVDQEGGLLNVPQGGERCHSLSLYEELFESRRNIIAVELFVGNFIFIKQCFSSRSLCVPHPFRIFHPLTATCDPRYLKQSTSSNGSPFSLKSIRYTLHTFQHLVTLLLPTFTQMKNKPLTNIFCRSSRSRDSRSRRRSRNRSRS